MAKERFPEPRGLTSKKLKIFLDLVKKANPEQRAKMGKELEVFVT
jgi:hypothetical protein